MSRRRVVITGIGLASPIGNDLESVSDALKQGRHGIRHRDDWVHIKDLAARLTAEVTDLDLSKRWPRKATRSMGRVAMLATYASEKAIEDAGLPLDSLRTGRVGLAYGSTQGSSGAHEEWAKRVFSESGMRGVQSSDYLKLMSHTCPANLALHFGIRGRVISTCSACVSSSQAIGFGYEAVRAGAQDVMICGGAEEMHFTHVGTFDVMYAASRRYNDHPELSPRPFDAARDGLVVGEGAGTLVLEDYERALARGAKIHAEIIGFATTCDGSHMTSPSTEGMADTMRAALIDARIEPSRIGYINAHATGTEVGDICESRAVHQIFG
ncbi:MAG: beta-ketoacyl-ACP synthase, partial [Polyangiaceae bacterium]|nr:beta-ketoacyl-ACP synthase [Polyangiaceae bacterium]